MVELFRDTGALRVRFGRNQVFFRVADALIERTDIEIGQWNRFFRKHNHMLPIHFGKTSAHEQFGGRIAPHGALR